ncbi:MAG TPA: DNA cytosine methyltransferase [Tepidisphaeraceae bacterium]|jgi:DNA (cytosine-5)-methyltransferase 1|nr:DNA cytosine methyltransferase [Tepidisphaeraceae bacterium]
MKRLTCIDLFCGCGGFSLGLERAGFSVLAAIDFNPEAITVFQTNFPRIAHALCRDLTLFPPQELAGLLGTQRVDVIVGGPPCQGFSTVRQRDGANNGPRMVEDKRRHLFREFLQYVEYFRPKVFVMENVPGIKSAAGGKYFTEVQKEAREMGYRVHPQVEKAFNLGVPQKRQRQLIIGTRLDHFEYLAGELQPAPRAKELPTLGEAIGDLPPVRAGGGTEEADYDMERRKTHVAKYGRRFLHDTLEVRRAAKLTAHRARPHSDRDLRDFARLREGEHCAEAMKRGERFEFPYDRGVFKDRYTRQHRNEPCSTIVAHLSKDGLMFIHPTQNRSLTPREAARVQSFPDWFKFPVARTHQFRVIGNAVPPLVAEAIGIAIKSYLEMNMKNNIRLPFALDPLPTDHQQAVQWLLQLVNAAETKSLRNISTADFLRGWYAVGFLYAGLHPDSALEHGAEVSNSTEDVPEFSKIEPRLLAPYYVQSGWPVLLEPIADEAWRRYDADELKDDEFYCSEAVVAGMCYRNPELVEGVKRERQRVLA